MSTLADINCEIERLRLLLNGYVNETPLTHPRIIELSQKLDLLIMIHYQLLRQNKHSTS